MKVLLTGISGFIGSYLCRRLVADGYEVHGLYETDRNLHKNDLPDGQQWICNLTDHQRIDEIVGTIKPDFVIHLAAKTEVALSFDNYLEVSEVNYVGTVALAEANRQYNPNLKLFLMASTMETYGHHEPSEGPFTEETPQRPMAPYSVAKMACERYLEYMAYAYQFPYCILRQTNAYGRTDNDFFVVERIITQMLHKDECRLGEGAPVRNFIWIDDLIDLYTDILKRPDLAQGEIFVTGPDNGITISALADMIAGKTNFKGSVVWGTIPKRPGEIYYLNSDPAKATRVFGWHPKTSLSEGLDKAIDIWR